MDTCSQREFRHPTPHPPDSDLLRAADGELEGRRQREIRSHLEACWSCRARMASLERTIDGFMRAHAANGAALPGMASARLRLEAELVRLDRESSLPLQQWTARLAHVLAAIRPQRYAGLALSAAALCAVIAYVGAFRVRAASIPDPRLTPGAASRLTRDDVCASHAAAARTAIPAPLARAVFAKYGIRNPAPRAYEVDYLITPALGGSNDIRNLWPQPYSAGIWNAHIKDALEEHLHELVCKGDLDLAVAQREISGDWIAAYKKYFRTESPLASHAGFTEDAPWE